MSYMNVVRVERIGEFELIAGTNGFECLADVWRKGFREAHFSNSDYANPTPISQAEAWITRKEHEEKTNPR